MSNAPSARNTLEKDVLDYLRYAIGKDQKKHGASPASGLRDTREIAERHGVSLDEARHILQGLCDDGKVDKFPPINGRTNIWALKEDD